MTFAEKGADGDVAALRIIRVVPRVERGERINVGVILSCVDVEFLATRIDLDRPRLLVLDPDIDAEAVRAGLATITAVSAGGPGSGPIGALPQRERFRWLVSPRSTVIQMWPVHTDRTTDPAAALQRRLDTMPSTPHGTLILPPQGGSHELGEASGATANLRAPM